MSGQTCTVYIDQHGWANNCGSLTYVDGRKRGCTSPSLRASDETPNIPIVFKYRGCLTFIIPCVLDEVILQHTHEDGGQEAGQQKHRDARVDDGEPVNLQTAQYKSNLMNNDYIVTLVFPISNMMLTLMIANQTCGVNVNDASQTSSRRTICISSSTLQIVYILAILSAHKVLIACSKLPS